MTRSRIRLITGAIAAVLLLPAAILPAVAAAPAAVAEENGDGTGDDPLQQTIDPDQAQGTGRVVADSGHLDFGPTLSTGEWRIQIHDDREVPRYWRNPEDVVMRVNDESLLEMPDSDQYAFLGIDPGTEVWVIPQTQHPDVVWMGWNTQEPNVLDQLDMGTTLSVLGVEGPGDVSVYLQSGNFGDPEPLWSTLNEFPQESWIESNLHAHANWVFTEPGVYLIEIQFDAQLKTGEAVSARDTLRFAVGDGTDAESAFDMEIDESLVADAGGDGDDSGDEDPAAAAGSDDDGGIGSLLMIVVAAVGIALLAAVLVIVVASRRAKARARAAGYARTEEVRGRGFDSAASRSTGEGRAASRGADDGPAAPRGADEGESR